MKHKTHALATIVVGLLLAPFCYILVSNLLVASRQSITPPDWINIPRLLNIGFSIICVISAFMFESKIRGKSADILVKTGQDPEFVAFICGASSFLAPASLALLLVFLGSATVDVKVYSALAFLAILGWSWRYRKLFHNSIDGHEDPTNSKAMEASDSKVILSELVRAYTIVLSILGVLSLLFIAMKILLIVRPPEDYVAHAQTAIFLVAFYSLLSITCWSAVVMRIRKSPFAVFATRAISSLLLVWVPFGTAAFVYWIWRVRKSEEAEPIDSVDMGHRGPIGR